MALIQIDNVAALVVIDMQKGVVAMPTVHPAVEIIDSGVVSLEDS